jgi:predicted outer membrane repeat protein
MGYLNNASVTVDAILTTTGRKKLADGTTGGLGIAYFALGDDEVNYDLWNPAHPLGSDYYGIVIENMPVLEASPIPSQNLKSKLITLDKSQNSIPLIANVLPNITFTFAYNQSLGFGGSVSTTNVTPQSQVPEDAQFGYNCSFDSKYLAVDIITPAPNTSLGANTIGDSGTVLTKSGLSFRVSLTPNINQGTFAGLTGQGILQVPVTFTGNGSGIRTTMTVNISYTLSS